MVIEGYKEFMNILKEVLGWGYQGSVFHWFLKIVHSSNQYDEQTDKEKMDWKSLQSGCWITKDIQGGLFTIWNLKTVFFGSVFVLISFIDTIL